MSYILLRRQVFPNPDATGPANVTVEDFWDTDRRTYYSTQSLTTTTPFELAIGAEVQRVTLLNGKDRVFYYAGNGRVQTRHVTGTTNGGVVCTLSPPGIVPNPAYSSGADDAAIDVLPQLGAGPYQITFTGDTGYSQTKTAPNALYPIRFYHARAGNYVASVVDSLGCQSSTQVQISINPSGVPYGIVLQDSYSGDSTDGSGSRIVWNTDRLAIENYGYQGGGTDGYFYQNQDGNVVDGYYLPDGVTFRTVYADGNGGVYFRDSNSTDTNGQLLLDNLILFNPDTAAEQNGGVLVEVISTDLPVTFTLNGVSNQTGSFDGLDAGDNSVRCVDAAGKSLVVPFTLRLEYGLWKILDFDDLDSTPLRLELWLQGYDGNPATVFGQGSPVVLKSDGLNTSLGGQGDVPSSVGTSADLAFLVEPDTFEEVVVSDGFKCRADVYRANALQFRGYVQPDIYTEPLQSGLLAVEMTATDGLAGLKDDNMLGHIGQRLLTRRPLLNTLLHCLSRCGISLPVQLYVNRRSTEMSDDDAPELAATTPRLGYWDIDKDEPIDMRTVVDAVCQALGGTLVQREGTWQLRSLLEALDVTAGRAYKPAGTANGSLSAPAPTGFIAPLSRDTTIWGWEEAKQQKAVRPGWKSLTGTTDLEWLKNAFPAGQVFSDKYSWLEDGSKLRGIAGWTPPPGGSFPLVLVRAGEKGTDHSTQWLRSSTPALMDDNYLESPVLPLVAVPESCPAFLTVSAKLVPSEILYHNTVLGNKLSAATPEEATLWVELIIDGQRPAKPTAVVLKLAGGITDKDTTYTEQLADLPAGTKSAVLRLYAWTAPDALLLQHARDFDRSVITGIGDLIKYDFGTGVYRVFQSRFLTAANNPATPAPTGLPDDPNYLELPTVASTGKLLVSSVAIQLRPQGATWDGADNFRADGPAGTVRPTEALEVYHADVPIEAGLFEGNIYAFGKAVALTDGSMSTAWARTLDKQAAPLFEANVYDALILRSGTSRLLTGAIRHQAALPPLLLDSVDTPYDVPGRRFGVGATEWNMKQCLAQISAVEIGPGADAPDPMLDMPDGVRITHRVYAYAPGKYAPYVRLVHGGGVRVRHR